MVRTGRTGRWTTKGVHDGMKLNSLKNILSADRCILLVSGKEYQYRRSEISKMFHDYGNHNIINIYSFTSKDNAIEINLAPLI